MKNLLKSTAVITAMFLSSASFVTCAFIPKASAQTPTVIDCTLEPAFKDRFYHFAGYSLIISNALMTGDQNIKDATIPHLIENMDETKHWGRVLVVVVTTCLPSKEALSEQNVINAVIAELDNRMIEIRQMNVR